MDIFGSIMSNTNSEKRNLKWAILNSNGNVMQVRSYNWNGGHRRVRCLFETREEAREMAREIRARGTKNLKVVKREPRQKPLVVAASNMILDRHYKAVYGDG